MFVEMRWKKKRPRDRKAGRLKVIIQRAFRPLTTSSSGGGIAEAFWEEKIIPSGSQWDLLQGYKKLSEPLRLLPTPWGRRNIR